jgi:hypothetical protein
MKGGGPATAGILQAAIRAARGTADALGDAGDEEAALVLDECSARADRIVRARAGPPPTEHEIMGAVLALQATAEALDEAEDGEAAGLFEEAAGRLAALLDRRSGHPDWRKGPRHGPLARHDCVKPLETCEKQGDFDDFPD